MVEHPEKLGLKVKNLWDAFGPGYSFEHVFGKVPIPRSLLLRQWFYEKRVAIYKQAGLRSAGYDIGGSSTKFIDALMGRDKWKFSSGGAKAGYEPQELACFGFVPYGHS